MIFTGFSPNTKWKDTNIALSYIFLPWKWFSWKNGKYVEMLEQSLKHYLPAKHAVTFDSGRSSLQASLKVLGVGEGDEVIVQTYTCVVVVNAILALGAKPVYVDVQNNFNAKLSEIERKITGKTKVIIAQHTFGTPAEIEQIVKIAQQRNIKVIEDCAHSLGAELDGKKLGTFGDMAMWSFGSDKVISSVRGGAVTTDNDELASKLVAYRDSLPALPRIIIWQHLNNPILFPIGKALYSVVIGKAILYLAKKLNIINKIVYDSEKVCEISPWMPAKMPNVLARLANEQLKHVNARNAHRKKIARMYD